MVCCSVVKGEVHSKMKVSYLVVFGALSRMVKVQGACHEPFWVYSQPPLNRTHPFDPEISGSAGEPD